MKEHTSQSLSGKRWIIRHAEESQAVTLMQKFGVSSLLAQLLVMRGQNVTSVPQFLSPSLRDHLPDPLLLKDMDKAIERLALAILAQEKILIWGDYDVDGATSSALLCRFFKSIGYPVSFYIPDRVKEGYGPNIQGIQKFIDQGYKVMVTVDCGTTSFDVFEASEGLDSIILDHHAAEAKLPKAYAIVNPNRLDEQVEVTQTFGHLAAVGISFLCVVALNRELRQRGFYETVKEPDLLSLLDLVALGTVCDVMPLQGLNRTFVTQGLKVMAKRKNLGLRNLADYAGLDQTPNSTHLGFMLGPRINAGGRVGEASLGARLLSTDNPEEAFDIAKTLDGYNKERQALESDALEQALLQADSNASVIVVHDDRWHEGVIGIVAGRLKDKYHKPTAVIAWTQEGMGKGSARSISGFDFGAFIHRAHHKGLVLKGGGHAMAAGFSLTREQLSGFIDFLQGEVSNLVQNEDLMPKVVCDGYLTLPALTPALLEEIEKLSPFGMGNPTPKFIFQDVIVQSFHVLQDQHVKCRFSQGDGHSVEGISFRIKETPLGKILTDQSRRPLDLLASPKLDTWGGKTKVTLMIEDVVEAKSSLKMAG